MPPPGRFGFGGSRCSGMGGFWTPQALRPRPGPRAPVPAERPAEGAGGLMCPRRRTAFLREGEEGFSGTNILDSARGT